MAVKKSLGGKSIVVESTPKKLFKEKVNILSALQQVVIRLANVIGVKEKDKCIY